MNRSIQNICVRVCIWSLRTVSYTHLFETDVTLGIPCSRCLAEVRYPVSVQVTKEVDFSELDEEDSSYIEDKYLDLDILIFDEVVPKLPSRVLCKEDCKGLCPVCGTNLNEKECRCV